jgi:outer membrane protein, adhesin transport system
MAVGVLSVFSLVPLSAGAVTLQDELKDLLAHHPRLAAERSVVKSADAKIDEAYAGFLPTVGLSGDAGHEDIEKPATAPTNLNRNKITLTVSQNLFSGFGTRAGHSGAKLRADSAAQRLRSLRQNFLIEGITAYYNVLRQSRLIKINKQNEDTIKKQLKLEDERVERGSGKAVDVLLAKTRLQLATERRVLFEGGLHEARARYVQFFGREPAIPEMENPKFDLTILPADIESAESASVKGNPILQAGRLDVAVAQERRAEVKSGFFPRVDLVGKVNREDDIDGTRGIRRDWSVVLQVSWDLYSGLSTKSAARAAGYDHSAAQSNLYYGERQVKQELAIAWHQLETNRKRVDLLKNAGVIAVEVFEARQHLRRSGKETAINVLDAQSEVFGAQLNLTSAEFDSQIAAFRVLFAMGELTTNTLGL